MSDGIFEKVLNMLAGCARSSPKTSSYFYISILFYLISVSLNENVMGQKLDICAEPRLKVAYLHNISTIERTFLGL